jgi:hypothetical protein
MPPQYEDDDEEDKKPGPPAGFVEDQDRWNLQGKGPVARPGAPAAAAAKPAQRQPRGGTEPSRDEMIEGMSKLSGVYGQKEHPEVDLASEGIEDIRSGEYQRGAHKLFGALGETLRPLAPLMGEAGLGPLVKGLGASIIGGQVGKHVLPAVGITPELGEDIGTYGAPLATLPRAIYRGTRGGTSYEPRTPYRAGRPELTGAQEPAPEGLPRTRAAGAPPEAAAAGPIAPEQPLAPPTAGSLLDVLARRKFGRPYDVLTSEEKAVVARDVGTPEVERRVTRGEAPGVVERRAENMPLPTRSPEAGAPRIAPPGQANAEPAPSGTLPRTGPPAAPPPTTIGGETIPRASLDEILRQATGQRRGQPSEEGKPPPVDPMKQEFPDPAIRQFARANGAELVRAAGENMDAVQAVHDLSNVEIRQAAINAGIDVGQKHVGSRMLLGEAQVSRQDLIDQMIRQGVKAEDIPGLAGKEAVPYTKPMPIPERAKNTRFGVDDLFVHYHELAHAIIAGLHGFNPEEIASHRHPLTQGAHAAASVLFDFRNLFGSRHGQLDPAKLSGGVGEKFLEVLAGGQAAGEVLNGMPKDVNFTASGDKDMAARFMTAMGIPKSDWVKMWDQAYDRAKAKLTPEVVAIIKDEATRREDNLSPMYHYSGNRVAHIVERVRDATEEARTGTQGYATPVGAEAYRSGQQALPFPESRAPEGPVRPTGAQTLKAFRPPQNTYKFEVFDNTQPGAKEVEVQAVDRKTAWKKLGQMGRYSYSKMLSEEKPEPGPPLQLPPKGSTTPLFKKPADVGEKPTVADFVDAMRQRNKQLGLKPVIAADQPEAALGRALKIGEAELDFQRMRPNSGEQWYNQDAKRYDTALQKYHDALKDPTKLTIAKAIQAGMSLGNKTIPAITNTLDAIDEWQRTGKIPLKNPATKGAWPNGQFNAYMHGFRTLQNLINKKGEAGAVDWLMSQHPTSEIRQFRPSASGKAADMQYGAMALGDKYGPFFLNNMGIAEKLTADLWFSRTWNRWMSTPFQSILKDGKRTQQVVESPRNPGERAIMEDFARTLAQKKGLEIKQVQAILWNYEQALYKLHGFQNAEQPSYGQAAEALVRERIQRRDAQGGAGTPRARQDAGTRRSPRDVRGSP